MMKYHKEISDAVEQASARMEAIGLAVYEHPETGHEEHFACSRQTGQLREDGWNVTAPFCNLETAYCAEYSNGEGPSVGICSEYDALPVIGHACGHHLIMTAALLAATAVREVMKTHGIAGTVKLFGTPAEEELGGKIDMIAEHAFDGSAAVLICHPFSQDGIDPGNMAVSRYDVVFHGKASHAAASPELGINALDAVNLLFAGLAAWRQQFAAGDRVHGIITEGGIAANIIPDRTGAFFYVRSLDNARHKEMEKRFADIVKGAALMTGCTFELQRRRNPYAANRRNPALEKLYIEEAEEFGLHPEELTNHVSTDFADVTQVVPGANFFFNVLQEGQCFGLHSELFRDNSISPEAWQAVRKIAKTMAATALIVLTDETVREAILNSHLS